MGVKPDKKDPLYTVCEIDGSGKLKIVDREVSAKTQVAAMDEVNFRFTTGRDGESRTLAAFLAGSLRTKRYRNRTTVVSEGELVDPDVALSPSRRNPVPE